MKKRSLKKCLLTAFLTLSGFSFCAVRVYGGALTGGATEWTQLANNAALISNLSQVILQTQQIISNGKYLFGQLEDMKLQAESLANMDFSTFLGFINTIETTLSQGKALSYTAIGSEQRFKRQFEGYDRYLQEQYDYNPQHFENKYTEWHDSLNDSIQGTMRLHNVTYDHIRNEEAQLQLLHARSKTAVGRNQLLKLGSDISFIAQEHMRKLLTIEMQHSQVHSQYMAYRANEEKLQHARKRQFMEQGQRPILNNGEQW